jgi:hypothetical protein
MTLFLVCDVIKRPKSQYFRPSAIMPYMKNSHSFEMANNTNKVSIETTGKSRSPNWWRHFLSVTSSNARNCNSTIMLTMKNGYNLKSVNDMRKVPIGHYWEIMVAASTRDVITGLQCPTPANLAFSSWTQLAKSTVKQFFSKAANKPWVMDDQWKI